MNVPTNDSIVTVTKAYRIAPLIRAMLAADRAIFGEHVTASFEMESLIDWIQDSVDADTWQNNRGSTGILASIFGLNQATSARVLSVTQVNPRRSTVRVRGLATSGRMAYNPYGVGYYGSNAYAYQPDLSFSCSVDYQGRIRDVDINRR